jgi:hypothetical protein
MSYVCSLIINPNLMSKSLTCGNIMLFKLTPENVTNVDHSINYFSGVHPVVLLQS